MTRFSKMVDDGFAYLEARIETLEVENARLRRENSELLGKYIAAQDLAYTRMVQSFLDAPDGALRSARLDAATCASDASAVSGQKP